MMSEPNEKTKLSNLHDWEILGVNVSRFTRSCEISLYFPDEDAHAVIRFNGVKRFFLSEMLFQNVILDVLLFDEENNSDYFERGCKLLKIKSSDIGLENGLRLIYFEPSVGAELACCFSDFEFVEGDAS